MRVLYFHQFFTSRAGATGTRSYEFAKRLVAKGHSVTMVCGSSERQESGLSGGYRFGVRSGMFEGIDVVELEIAYSNHQGKFLRSVMFLRYALRSLWIALTYRYDIVFATSTPLTAGIPGAFARWLRRKPFVFEVRDLWPELPRAMGVLKNPVAIRVLEWLETFLYRSADACVGLAPGIVEGMRRKGVREEALHLIPNGSDLDLFLPREARPQFEGVNADDFVAVFCGAHGLANGLHTVLDAAAELKRRGETGIRLVFVGDGPTKREMVERARKEGLDSCVFLPSLPKEELARRLPTAHVGLMVLANVPAFYYGTSPNKFFDYLASGLPVLVCFPGWVADLICENGCGVAVPPDDPRAFVDALVEMRDHREKLQSMKVAARALAEREFGRDLLAEKFVALLETVGERVACRRVPKHLARDIVR